MRWFWIGIAIMLGIFALAEFAMAHEEGTPWAEWFMSLKQPDNPIASCCGPADQFYATEYHADPDVPGGYVVMVDGFDEAVRVPPNKVNQDEVNPTGRGVIFMSRSWEMGEMMPGNVYCFVPSPAT